MSNPQPGSTSVVPEVTLALTMKGEPAPLNTGVTKRSVPTFNATPLVSVPLNPYWRPPRTPLPPEKIKAPMSCEKLSSAMFRTATSLVKYAVSPAPGGPRGDQLNPSLQSGPNPPP